MALATVSAVVRELSASKEDFGFDVEADFLTWISNYLDWYGSKVEDWVGAATYDAANLDLVDAEIFLTCARMLSVLYGSSAGDGEAGWAIGSLRINQSMIAQEGLEKAIRDYRMKAMGKLSGYVTHTFNRVEVMNPTEDETIIYPVDRFYLSEAT